MNGAGTGYIVAGYTICLGVLFLYAVSLVLRRRRLGRAAELADRRPPAVSAGPSGPIMSTAPSPSPSPPPDDATGVGAGGPVPGGGDR